LVDCTDNFIMRTTGDKARSFFNLMALVS